MWFAGKLALPKLEAPKGLELGTGVVAAETAGGSGKVASTVWSSWDGAWLGLDSRECCAGHMICQTIHSCGLQTI